MNPNPTPHSEETIFAQALALPAAERAAYLTAACGADARLRRAVEGLLAAHEGDAGFMAVPATAGTADFSTMLRASRPREEAIGGRIGRYKLLQKIGEGGCGTVYMAEQEEPVRRRVALKVIKLGMDTKEVIARFEAERQALALMDHTNIARVLDAGETDTGRPFFVMELVRGVKITEYCDQHQLATAERLKLFTQVCHAVQHAHQKGIIHRDLKPSNILVTLHDGTPIPKVIDFGIAKATQGRLTDSTLFTAFEQFIGTPAYMSPEQAEMSCLDIDTRSDIYSLGVLLYELLTGRTPFESKELLKVGLDEMRRQIREVEPPRPSTRLRTLDKDTLSATAQHRHIDSPKLINLISGDLDWIVMRCLEKDRTRRYETATSLAQDLQRHLDHEPVVARPAGSVYRFQKMVRRNRLAFGAAAAVGIALVLGLMGSLWQARRASREAVRANVAEKEARSEAAIASAVNEFLNRDLLSLASGLSQSDEGFTPNPNLTVRQALDRAAKRLDDGRFKDLPLVEAAVRNTIGNAYIEVEVQDASRHLERAYELRRQHLGVRHPETLHTAHSLFWAYQNADRVSEAAVLGEEVVRLRTEVLGREHPDTLHSLDKLAVSYYSGVGRVEDAVHIYEEVVRLNKARLGDNHLYTLRAMFGLARTYELVGRVREAVMVGEDAMTRIRATLGPDHHNAVFGLLALGRIYRSSGRVPEAVTTLEEALRRYQATKGPENHGVANCMRALAEAYRETPGRAAEVVPMLEAALKLHRASLGSDHRVTLLSARTLAQGYLRAGRHSDALPLSEEAVRLCRAKYGPDSWRTLLRMVELAETYLAMGRRADALGIAEEVSRLLKPPPPGADAKTVEPAVLTVMNNLSFIYRAAGRQGEALKLLEEAVRIGKAKRGIDHKDTLIEMANLASAYRAAKRSSDALPLAQEVFSRRKAMLGAEHANTLGSMYLLAGIHDDNHDWSQSEPLRREFLAAVRKKNAADTPTVAAAEMALGHNLLAQQKFSEAEAMFRSALATREAKMPDSPLTFNARSSLGAALAGQKKFTDAEPLLISGYEGMKTREAIISPAGKFRIKEALERLVQFYTEKSDLQKAAEWRRKLDEFNAAATPAAAPEP